MKRIGWMFCAAAALAAEGPVEIGSRRELFVDQRLIDRMSGAELRAAQPVDRGVALRLDRPWEGAFSGYFTVLRDGVVLRLYYRGRPNAGQDGTADEVTCLAESHDGVTWQKPELGLFEVAGTRKNNVILAGDPPFSHNFAPMLDARPGAPAAERYKALAGIHRTGLFAFVSPDGVRWRKWRDRPVIPSPKGSAFDSQNVSFWSESEGVYVCYFRTFKQIGGVRYRWVSRTQSADYEHWSEPREVSFGDAPAEHLYTNQVGPYYRAPQLYVGIAARFFPGKQILTAEQARAIGVDADYFKDVSDAVLLTGRGGALLDRTFREAFLRPGPGWENWVSRSNYPAQNLVETGPGEMSFYVARNYGQPTAYIRRYVLRVDGLASVHAGAAGGELLTRQLRFQGSKLEINYSTSAGGSIRIQILDEDGDSLSGFDSGAITGDEIERVPGLDLSKLAGRVIRLKFTLRDADLWSLRFRD